MSTVESRLDDLARENQALKRMVRRTKRVLCLLSLSLIVIVAAGAAKLATRRNADFDIVTARQVRIVDEDGKAKVLLAGNKQANPQIVQGYVAVLDDKENAAALLGHWGNGDILWFVNGDENGNNLYLGARKDSVVVQSANTKAGKYNYRLYADGTNSGIEFTTTKTASTADSQQTVTKDLAEKGTP